MSNHVNDAAWLDDPTGRFALRYYDGSTWTAHVSREGHASTDPIPTDWPPTPPCTPTADAPPEVADPPGSTPPVLAPVPGTATLVSLPDDPESAKRRRTFGWVLIAINGVVLASLALPWVKGTDEFSSGSRSLSGFEFSGGVGVAFMGVILGLYALQGIAKPRVRFHVAAVVVLVTMLAATVGYASFATEDDVAKLESSSQAPTSQVNVGSFRFQAQNQSQPGSAGIRFRTGTDGPKIADHLTYGAGLTVALLAELAAIWPLSVLWRDDRKRRRDAGLLI